MALTTLVEVRGFVPLAVSISDPHLQLLIDSATPPIEHHVGPVESRAVTRTVTKSGKVILDGRVISASVTRNGVAFNGFTLNAAAGLIDGLAAGDVVTYTVGFAVIPPAIRLAALYIVQHAVESMAGSTPTPYGGGADESFVTSRGFFIPNRAKELLAPWALGERVA